MPYGLAKKAEFAGRVASFASDDDDVSGASEEHENAEREEAYENIAEEVRLRRRRFHGGLDLNHPMKSKILKWERKLIGESWEGGRKDGAVGARGRGEKKLQIARVIWGKTGMMIVLIERVRMGLAVTKFIAVKKRGPGWRFISRPDYATCWAKSRISL